MERFQRIKLIGAYHRFRGSNAQTMIANYENAADPWLCVGYMNCLGTGRYTDPILNSGMLGNICQGSL